MENLRWIILAVGLVVVLLIYLIGKSKDKTKQLEIPETVTADELPQISAEESFENVTNKLDDVFVASEINQFELNQELVEEVTASVDDVLVDVMTAGAELKSPKNITTENAEQEQDCDDVLVEEEYQDDLVVIHVQAKSAYFSGADLLKVINHQQLKFGDMNIYHAFDDSHDITFSMSNMLQPGHFEPDTISDMRTPGVILFMQLSLVNDPEQAFERMLHCADALSRELDAKVTSAKQQVLTEDDITNFRAKATHFK